jgi:hypothetical protein
LVPARAPVKCRSTPQRLASAALRWPR